jgi:hypothetical protein
MHHSLFDCPKTPVEKAVVQITHEKYRCRSTGTLKTVMRYDHGRENMEQNAVNFLRYEED